MIKHVSQPPGSRFCGQACVAMVLGCSLDDARQLMPYNRATRTRDLLNVLERSAVDSRMRTVRDKPIQEPAIVRAYDTRRGRSAIGHLVLFAAGKVHDPEWSAPLSRAEWVRRLHREGWAVASYLRVRLERGES